MFSSYKTQAISQSEPNFSAGICCSRGGPVTVGELYTDYVESGEVASRIMCSVTGIIVLQGIDPDAIMIIPAAIPGEMYNFKHIKVLASVVINEVTYSTTATGLFWAGGKN